MKQEIFDVGAKWGSTKMKCKENEDWVGFVTMTNGNETKDYAVSLEFAKHIAMKYMGNGGVLLI